MNKVANEADLIKCALCNLFNKRLDVLNDLIVESDYDNELASDIKEAWLDLMYKLDRCRTLK